MDADLRGPASFNELRCFSHRRWLAHNHIFILDRDHKKLVWHPDCGPDLTEFARDLAPGRAGILTDVHLTEQAKRHNAVGVGGMRSKAPHRRIWLGGEWQDLPSLPEVCGA